MAPKTFDAGVGDAPTYYARCKEDPLRKIWAQQRPQLKFCSAPSPAALSQPTKILGTEKRVTDVATAETIRHLQRIQRVAQHGYEFQEWRIDSMAFGAQNCGVKADVAADGLASTAIHLISPGIYAKRVAHPQQWVSMSNSARTTLLNRLRERVSDRANGYTVPAAAASASHIESVYRQSAVNIRNGTQSAADSISVVSGVNAGVDAPGAAADEETPYAFYVEGWTVRAVQRATWTMANMPYDVIEWHQLLRHMLVCTSAGYRSVIQDNASLNMTLEDRVKHSAHMQEAFLLLPWGFSASEATQLKLCALDHCVPGFNFDFADLRDLVKTSDEYADVCTVVDDSTLHESHLLGGLILQLTYYSHQERVLLEDGGHECLLKIHYASTVVNPTSEVNVQTHHITQAIYWTARPLANEEDNVWVDTRGPFGQNCLRCVSFVAQNAMRQDYMTQKFYETVTYMVSKHEGAPDYHCHIGCMPFAYDVRNSDIADGTNLDKFSDVKMKIVWNDEFGSADGIPVRLRTDTLGQLHYEYRASGVMRPYAGR